MSIRARVAVAAFLVALSLVLLFGGLNVALATRAATVALDAQLRQQWAAVEPPLVTAAFARRPGVEAATLRRVGVNVARVLVDGEERLRVGDDTVDVDAFPARAGAETVTTADGAWRVWAARSEARPALRDGATVLVQVAAPLAPVEAATGGLRRLNRLLALGAGAMAAGLGWLAAGVALEPLTRLRRRLETVDDPASDRESVPAAAEPAEVAELSVAFEGMLDRLAAADRRRLEAFDAARAFGAAASHELRTPLMSLGTNLDTLAAHPDLDPAARAEIVAAARDEHARLGGLLEALRLLGRGDLAEVPRQPVDLDDVVATEVARLRRRSPTAEVHLVGGVPEPVIGWREGLEVAVRNLLDNADRHGRSPDGVLRLAVETDTDGDLVRLVVADRGPGIPEGFDPLARFSRGSDSEGAGLGLALVDQQARLHDGSLTVGNGEPAGASCVLTLSRGTHTVPTSSPQDPPAR